jgi:hypothetical protein
MLFPSGFGTAGQQAVKEHTMTGCLQKSSDAKTFWLTHPEKGNKTVEISDTTVTLAPHVGHKIEITGTTDTALEDKQAKEKKEGEKPDHFMKITAIKMVASKCP